MNVKFRIFGEEHLELVRNWRNKSDVSKYMYTNQYISKEEHIKWYNQIRYDSTKVYWVIYMDEKPVGVVNLYDINRSNKRCYWAYYLADPTVRGKGLGRLIELNILNYVFNELRLNKLCCEVLSSNELVIKIHQKYGSKIEGIFRKHIYKNKKFHDIVCMAILKEEWEVIKKNFDFDLIEIDYSL